MKVIAGRKNLPFYNQGAFASQMVCSTYSTEHKPAYRSLFSQPNQIEG